MNNIAEGFERNNNKEFAQFLGYTKGSAGEIRSMLYVALDQNHISEESFKINYKKALAIIKQISNFKKYLRNYLIKETINKVRLFLIHIINVR